MPDGRIDDVVLVHDELLQSSASHAQSTFPQDLRPEALQRAINEPAYRWAFSDVAQAIRSGQWLSAQDHYLAHGCREQRALDERYVKAAGGIAIEQAEPLGVACSVDEVFVSESGRCLIIGWLADVDVPLTGLALAADGAVVAATLSWARCRRPDAEAAIGAPHGKLLGFWAVMKVDSVAALCRGGCVLVRVADNTGRFPVRPKLLHDGRLRDIIFEYFAGAAYFGNPNIESFLQLEHGVGDELIDFNVDISTSIMSGSFVARYGRQHRRYVGSIIVCLYGKAEFLFLQSAMFTAGDDWSDYEFIYVSNSPELAETLQKEAAIAHRVYGLDITLVLLPDNAGFGGANNVAASYARSDRLLVVNPDVFPRRPDWARAHSDLVRTLSASSGAIFGAPLYYDDGSLMHGGMYFELDEGWSVHPRGVERRRMARVEHYGKGAPADDGTYVRAREVPAVTGAFISIDRRWFEAIGGFSLHYVFGHYEDADICLKSASKGRPVWLHNVPFWHLEGKGSTRRLAHEGGSLLNRWHFTRTWSETIARDWLAPVLLA